VVKEGPEAGSSLVNVLSPRQFGDLATEAGKTFSGATVDVGTGQRKTSGWAVALKGAEHVEPKATFGPESIQRYVGRHSEALSQPAHHLGLWHEEKSDPIYHDVSVLHPNTYAGGVRAIAGGYHHEQQAIYNLDRGETVTMLPVTRRQDRETRRSIRGLRKQRPEPEGKVSDMPTSQLGAALRNRRSV
jgi:hypothetical protein